MKSPKAEASSDYLESSRGIVLTYRSLIESTLKALFLSVQRVPGLDFVKSSPIWVLCYLFPSQASFLAWVLVLVVNAFLVLFSVLPLVRIHRKNMLKLKEELKG